MEKGRIMKITSYMITMGTTAAFFAAFGSQSVFAANTAKSESAISTEASESTEGENAEAKLSVQTEEEMSGTRTFTDDLGRSVEVPDDPERVAALIGSFADIWLLSGGEDSLVATAHDAWTSFDMNLGEDVEDLGSAKDISSEKLLASEPDLVIGSVSTGVDMELLPVLEEMGIPALYFDVDCFEDYLRMLKTCTEITGETDHYKTYGEGISEQVDDAIAMQDGSAPTVLYIRASSSDCKSKGSEGNVLGEMLSDLGCTNIADSDESLLENLSMEAILAADPDHVFIIYQAADSTEAEESLEKMLLSDPAWETLTAVKEGRVHIMDNRLFNLKPNAQWGDAYGQLAEILYGEGEMSETEEEA